MATFRARLRALAPERIFHVALLSAAGATIETARAIALVGVDELVPIAADVAFYSVIGWGLLIGGVTVTQAAVAPGWRRIPWFVVSVVASFLVSCGVEWALVAMGRRPMYELLGVDFGSNRLDNLWQTAAYGGLAIAFYTMRERQARLAAAARDAELERARAQRAVVESRLKVMQARVEPEFLFGALDQVQSLYAQAPDTAERLLDELIAYLRAALPQMRGDSSTVAREVELIRSYVAVLQVPSQGRLAIATQCPDELRGEAFPPMVLLPLVQSAVLPADVASRRRLAIDVERVDATLAVSLAVEGGTNPASWHDDAAEVVRESLSAAGNARCKLTFSSQGDIHCARVVLAQPGAESKQ